MKHKNKPTCIRMDYVKLMNGDCRKCKKHGKWWKFMHHYLNKKERRLIKRELKQFQGT